MPSTASIIQATNALRTAFRVAEESVSTGHDVAEAGHEMIEGTHLGENLEHRKEEAASTKGSDGFDGDR